MKKYETKESRLSLAREIAREGIVMLKNDNRLLPLAKEAEIAVFGRAQLQTIIGGGGSGASHSEETTLILDELIKVGLKTVRTLENYYRFQVELLKAEAPDQGDPRKVFEDLISSGMIYEIFGRYHAPEAEFELPDSLVHDIPQEVTAICVLGRSSGGEECDRRVEEDYSLTASERQMLQLVATHFRQVVFGAER